jgi:polar amino acid transport system substrate-binding protein
MKRAAFTIFLTALSLITPPPSFLMAQSSYEIVIPNLEIPRSFEKSGDGVKGFYVDLLKAIYESHSISLHFKIVPYARAIHEVTTSPTQGKAKNYILPSVYPEEVAGYENPQQGKIPLTCSSTKLSADDVVAILSNKSTLLLEESLNILSLSGKYIAWPKSYDYYKYIQLPGLQYQEVDLDHGLQLLDMGRLDAYLIPLDELRALRKEISFKFKPILKIPLLLCFQKTRDGEKHKAIYERRMEELKDTGELKKIFKKWFEETESYPYER